MSYDKELKEYREALDKAISAKKRYLSAALRREAEDYLSQLGGFTDHKAYREKVLQYWERYGYTPDELWFELSGSRDHVMDPEFVPVDLLYNFIRIRLFTFTVSLSDQKEF